MKVVHLLSTYNEKENIGKMIDFLLEQAKSLPEYEYVILVADSHSPDGTGEIVKKYAEKNKNIHLLETPRGLGVSLIAGYKYAVKELKADIVIPNDVDFQWDPGLIPQMLEKIKEGYDVVVPSRHVKGSNDNFSTFRKLTHFLSNTLLNYYWAGIHEVHDLAGNFKAIKVKGILDKVDFDRLNVKGFVIQATIIYELSKTGAKFVEIPAIFGQRRAGETKVGFNLQFIKDVLETVKNSTRIRLERSKKFIKFGVVGFVGYVVNASTLYLFANVFHLAEWMSWGFSTELAIISNFTWNNLWTFKENKIEGLANLIKKFIQFNATSFGALLIQTTVGTLGTNILGSQYRQILLPFIIVFLVLPYNYTMYNLFIWHTWKFPKIFK
jgi:dolichol-phosphate mannosyltransferase